MPQEPLPAPANRLAPTPLITNFPQSVTTTPPNLPQQQFFDLANRAKEGIEAGQQLLKSRSIAAENAARQRTADAAAARLKDYQAFIKKVESSNLPVEKQLEALSLYQAESGLTTQVGPDGSTVQQSPSYLTNLLSKFFESSITNPGAGQLKGRVESFFPSPGLDKAPINNQAVKAKANADAKAKADAEAAKKGQTTTDGQTNGQTKEQTDGTKEAPAQKPPVFKSDESNVDQTSLALPNNNLALNNAPRVINASFSQPGQVQNPLIPPAYFLNQPNPQQDQQTGYYV